MASANFIVTTSIVTNWSFVITSVKIKTIISIELEAGYKKVRQIVKAYHLTIIN